MNESPQELIIDEEAILAELKNIRIQKAKELSFRFFDKVKDIEAELQELYPNENLLEYKVFQLLIGSSPDKHSDKFDLPGGEVEKAIRNL